MLRRTRPALPRVAAELLEHEGLDAVTLRALGAAASARRGAPYRHFSDEDELLRKATDGDRLDAVIDGQTDW